MAAIGWVHCNTERANFAAGEFDGAIHVSPPNDGIPHHRLDGWDAQKVDDLWVPKGGISDLDADIGGNGGDA